MKRVLGLLLGFLLVFFAVATPAWSAAGTRWAAAISGGSADAMDSIDGAVLSDGDKCVVQTATGVAFYTLDADSGVTESIPTVIAPDDNPGNKRWLLVKTTTGNEFYVDPSVADIGAATTEGNRSLKDLVDLIGSSEKATIVFSHYGAAVTTPYTLSTSETTTSNLTLKPENGAVITDDASNASLAINGPFEAGLYKTFDWGNGTGNVIFGDRAVKETFFEWFGAVGDDSTDCFAAITQTIAATPHHGRITGLNGIYRTSAEIVIDKRIELIGVTHNYAYSNTHRSLGGFRIRSTISNGTDHVISIVPDEDLTGGIAGTIRRRKIENLTIFGSGNEDDGIHIETTDKAEDVISDVELRNINVEDVGGDGIEFDSYGLLHVTVDRIRIFTVGGNGISVDSDYVGGESTNTTFRQITTIMSTGYGFYLNQLGGAVFDNCKDEQSTAGGWYVSGGGNLFQYIGSEQAGGTSNDAFTADNMDNAMFISGKLGGNDTWTGRAINFINSADGNTFHGVTFNGDGQPLIQFSSDTNKCHFYDSVFPSGNTSTFDDVVTDAQTTFFANNIFYNTTHLAPGVIGNWTNSWEPNAYLSWGSESKGISVGFRTSAGGGFGSYPLEYLMGRLLLYQQSGDPPDPANNAAVIWTSDGSGIGTAGDLMLASKEGAGAVKYSTLMSTGGIVTLADEGTPTVKGVSICKTGGTANDPITDFDDGFAGQVITVLVKHSVTFDTTTAQDADHNLDGSSADITADSGDVLVWLSENGTTWHLVSNLDASVDNN